MFGKKIPVEELKLLAIDIETTGLDPKQDRILSIGWVPVNGHTIDLSGAQYFVISDHGDVSASVTVHGLTNDQLAQGVPLEAVVPTLKEALEGRLLLAHYAAIEYTFLRKVIGRKFNPKLVDTFALERRHMERMGTYPRGDDLRLPRVRTRYELPSYRNHNALTDAIACAELYVCMLKQFSLSTLRNLQV